MSQEPRIESVTPAAAISGGEVLVSGSGFDFSNNTRPRVRFGDVEGSVVICAENFMVARVPDGATSGQMVVRTHRAESKPFPIEIGVQIADNLHPVANPALDPQGNLFVTFSGSRGQKVPISIYKIDPNYTVKPFLSDLMNPTGLAFDRAGEMYVSSRHDGTIYKVSPDGRRSVYAEGMGVATGIAFDKEENLYVGDRSGTVFKISRDRQIFVFATLEPSVAAYHLAFGPDRYLYLTGPTTSSFDSLHRISPAGQVEAFYRGLGRPQGMAFDRAGSLYVVASLHGRRGVVRFGADRQPELVLAGQNLVGLAFAAGPALFVATTNAIYRLNWTIAGLPLLG